MNACSAKGPVHYPGVLLGDQALAVKAGDWNVRPLFHPAVFSGAAGGAVVFHGDDADLALDVLRVVDDDDPVGPVDVHDLHPNAAGEHKAVVCIELAELAVVDGQVHHDASAHYVVNIRTEEG